MNIIGVDLVQLVFLAAFAIMAFGVGLVFGHYVFLVARLLLSDSKQTKRQGAWRTLCVIFFIALLVNAIGLSYRGLRFLANYENTTVLVKDCDRTSTRGDDPLFLFEIRTDRLSYPVKRVEPTLPGSKGPEPAKDWCELVDSSISVYHFDKLKVAIPYDRDGPDVSAWSLFMSVLAMEASGGLQLAFIGLGSAAALAVGAVKYSIYALPTLQFRVKRRGAEATGTYLFRVVNQGVSLSATFILTGGYVIGLGLALLKGMLYVESDSDFLTGLSVLICLALVSFAPALIFKGVYLLRGSSAEVIVFIRTLVLLAGLSIMVYNIWSFVIYEDLSQLALNSIWDLLVQMALGTFS